MFQKSLVPAFERGINEMIAQSKSVLSASSVSSVSIQDRISQFVSSEDYNEAFSLCLNSNDSELLFELCSNVDLSSLLVNKLFS